MPTGKRHGTPRFIYVSLQHPSPYYDDSYGVNSENNGPYGDAIVQELIPAVEERFRVIREPWARMLSGGSTGGWIALAHQIFYPDFYGATFASCPDSVDFRYHQIVDIYQDVNAYFIDNGWMKVDRPNQRSSRRQHPIDDEGRKLVRAGGRRSIAIGRTVGRMGSHLFTRRRRRIPEAPVGQNERSDRSCRSPPRGASTIFGTSWSRIGARWDPKVAHKLHVYIGDMDSYYLNNATELLNDFLSRADNPKFSGEIVFQRRAPHCWGPHGEELMKKMVAHIERHAPPGADVEGWKY